MQILKGHEGVVSTIGFSPDGETLVSAGRDGLVLCWNAWGEASELCRSTIRPQVLDISADGRYLVLGGHSGMLELWDLTSGAVVQQLKNDGPVSGLAFIPGEGRLVYSTGTLAADTAPSGGSVHFWSWRENRQLSPAAEIAPNASCPCFGVARLPATACLGDAEQHADCMAYYRLLNDSLQFEISLPGSSV